MVRTSRTEHPFDIHRGLHIQRLLQAITDTVTNSGARGQVAGG